MQQDVRLHEIEWMPLRAQGGHNKCYPQITAHMHFRHVSHEIMSGDSVIQLEWDLVLTFGQVCLRLRNLEIKLNVEGLQRSRVHDSYRACRR